MASLGSIMVKTIIFFTLLLSQTHLSEPTAVTTPATAESVEVHDLLVQYRLPKGLLPNNVRSYEIDDEGFFTVKLSSECYVRFLNYHQVTYGGEIKGRLQYGKVSWLSGIVAKKLIAWVPVRGIDYTPGSDDLTFNVGLSVLTETLPVSEFQDIPICTSELSKSS